MLSFFIQLRDKNDDNSEEYMTKMFENLEITKLDINRIYRYIDKCNNYVSMDDTDENE